MGAGSALRRVWSNPGYRFAALFLTYLAVGALLYPAVRRQMAGTSRALIEVTAWIEYRLLSLFSSQVVLADELVSLDGFSVQIIEECTAVYEILIFAAAVLAFPTGWGNRLIGFAIGPPLLYLINVLRIAMLIVVGRYAPALFEFMHIYFWQATLILMITSVWLLWIFKVVRRGEEALPAGS